MASLQQDRDVADGFIKYTLKVIQANGDPDETEHLMAEESCDHFLTAIQWVMWLQCKSIFLTDGAKAGHWQQFLGEVGNGLRNAIKWAEEKYPEALAFSRSCGSVEELQTKLENVQLEDVQVDWTWALNAAKDVNIITRILLELCEQISWIFHPDRYKKI